MSRLFRICFLVCLLCSSANTATADALVRNDAMRASTIFEIFADKDTLRVEAEVSFSDIPAFADLLPDELYEKLGNPPEPFQERSKRFFSEGLGISADGKPLNGRLKWLEPRDRIRRDPISGEALPLGEGDSQEKVLFFMLEYPLDGKPETISFTSAPHLPDRSTVAVGFVFYHLGVAVNDFRYFTRGATVNLDWRDPWHSKFNRRPMWRTYDSPLNVFLYAEPYEVRVEIVVRPLDLQPFVDLGLGNQERILPENYGMIQGKTASFLAGKFKLEIDGNPTEPILDRIHFLRRTLKSSTVIDPPEELSPFNAQLGVIFVVPRTELPQEAKLTWSFFPEKIESIPAASTDEAGPLPTIITLDDPVMVWTNFLKNPSDVSRRAVEIPPAPWLHWLRPLGLSGLAIGAIILLAACFRSIRRKRPAWIGIPASIVILAGSWWTLQKAGEVRINDDKAGKIVGTLLYNIYRSFDFRQEEAVYDMLAESVNGPMLETTYLETRRSLVLKNQGGAQAKVNQVEVEKLTSTPLDGKSGFKADVDWVVGGSVGHWGHIHQRKNRYKAEITVEAPDRVWKITDINLVSEERIQ